MEVLQGRRGEDPPVLWRSDGLGGKGGGLQHVTSQAVSLGAHIAEHT